MSRRRRVSPRQAQIDQKFVQEVETMIKRELSGLVQDMNDGMEALQKEIDEFRTRCG